MEAELTWGTTRKGQKLIIFNGNEFTKKLATKTNSTLEMFQMALTFLQSNNCHLCRSMLSNKNNHSHDIVPGKSEARQIVKRMKFTARNEQNPVNSAVIAT